MVRLYNSPSPGKRRFIENESDISATRSPICGAAVLGKITRGKSSSSFNNINTQTSGLGSSKNANLNNVSEIRTDFASLNPQKRGVFSSAGITYESIEDSPTFSAGRKSPESTESSTSGSSSRGDEFEEKSREEHNSKAGYVLQFYPAPSTATTTTATTTATANEATGEEESTADGPNSDRQQLRMDRLQAWMEQQQKTGGSTSQPQQGMSNNGNPTPQQSQGFSIRSRSNVWSTNLPVVTEERSFEAEDSSIASGAHSLKDDVEIVNTVRSYSSPERNEMLLAMRHLVLKQQTALSEMAGENRIYRRELQECRKLLQLAKEAYTRQQRQVESFMVERESTEAEVVWLREEVKTLRTEIQKQQEAKTTWTSSRSSDEVKERLQKARCETPERRKKALPEEATPAPSPVESPAQNPVTSSSKMWKLKSMLPDMNYLTDEAEPDDELPKKVHELRAKLENDVKRASRNLDTNFRQQESTKAPDESRDDGTLSPKMWQQDDDAHGPEDEMREWARSRSPNQMNPIRQQQETRGPSRQIKILAAQRESSRTPSEISTSSSFSGTSSAASQRSREEVVLFKNRLEAIQKKREYRKHIEENVGSRSGRVRFT